MPTAPAAWLAAHVPEEYRRPDSPVPFSEDLEAVGFYVPDYLGRGAPLELALEMPNLQVLQVLSAGFENALAILPPGVTLCNGAGIHDASTAELALALILASLRGIDGFARDALTGSWNHVLRPSLADRRVLGVGPGHIGRAIKSRAEAFEAVVTMVGRTARAGVHAVDELPALLPTADVVVLAVPLDESTHRLVDAAFLAAMPDGSLLVNVARGKVVDTSALLPEVTCGRLSAALDVTDPEPLPPDHPLWSIPSVLISPHVGGNSSAFLPRARRLVDAQLRHWARGEPLLNVVAGSAG